MLFPTDCEMKPYLSCNGTSRKFVWLHIKQVLMQQLVSLSISKETTLSILWLIFIIYANVQSFLAARMADWNKTDKQKCPCVCLHICVKSFSFPEWIQDLAHSKLWLLKRNTLNGSKVTVMFFELIHLLNWSLYSHFEPQTGKLHVWMEWK